MRRAILFVVVLLTLFVSCERRARIIPVNKFQRIYAEMYLADRWLEYNRHFRKTADTTLFYESIFRHYGYDLKDYYASVDYYMDHPDKFEKIMDGAINWLHTSCRQAEGMRNEIQKFEALRDSLVHYADSVQYAEIMAYIDSVLQADSLGFFLRDSLMPKDSVIVDTVAFDRL